MVICTDDQKHGLSDGDKVIFSEVQGMTELNNMGPVGIKVRGQCFFLPKVAISFLKFSFHDIFNLYDDHNSKDLMQLEIFSSLSVSHRQSL